VRTLDHLEADALHGDVPVPVGVELNAGDVAQAVADACDVIARSRVLDADEEGEILRAAARPALVARVAVDGECAERLETRPGVIEGRREIGHASG
jgi:hypothetical protein